ncbi:microcin C ABC transporter permease YejB [Thorsellia anophelis]|uniref:Inner membrane ABC transporter permease protein YejB n=1 Tax=Thorsellia anophelis DSM 18579 TaxID=1123402 RepID=A0A1H9ZTW1_9GAMM|nr:microcin C ABC transporter permease YejB [Thorsellia anophelis]SES85186.1 microcin C transport system permease protein [Thorsellia anophelis DSM 18579]
MLIYFLKRLLLLIPTLWAIVTLNFFIVQVAPGGPVEQAIAKIELGENSTSLHESAMNKISGNAGIENISLTQTAKNYRGSRGLDDAQIEAIKKQYGFDKPIHIRYVTMLKNYIHFNFGDSLFKGSSVINLIVDRLPVSISLGLWSTLLIYFISIPLGIKKAIKDGSKFDVWSSLVIVIGNAIPGFLFAMLLIVLFAGGSFLDWFPLRGLSSINSENWPLHKRILDYFHHISLPILATVISGFAGLTLLTKNSFLAEMNKQYVVTARSKGLTENKILYGHIFRNAMLIIIAGFPGTFIAMFFTGSILIEVIFSLNGLGLLGYEATLQRDYPVIFGTLFIFTLLGLLIKIISDLTYAWVDPRITFEKSE